MGCRGREGRGGNRIYTTGNWILHADPVGRRIIHVRVRLGVVLHSRDSGVSCELFFFVTGVHDHKADIGGCPQYSETLHNVTFSRSEVVREVLHNLCANLGYNAVSVSYLEFDPGTHLLIKTVIKRRWTHDDDWTTTDGRQRCCAMKHTLPESQRNSRFL